MVAFATRTTGTRGKTKTRRPFTAGSGNQFYPRTTPAQAARLIGISHACARATFSAATFNMALFKNITPRTLPQLPTQVNPRPPPLSRHKQVVQLAPRRIDFLMHPSGNPEASNLVQQRWNLFSGQEKITIGSEMSQIARRIVWLSIPQGPDPLSRKRLFYKRFYNEEPPL